MAVKKVGGSTMVYRGPDVELVSPAGQKESASAK